MTRLLRAGELGRNCWVGECCERGERQHFALRAVRAQRFSVDASRRLRRAARAIGRPKTRRGKRHGAQSLEQPTPCVKAHPAATGRRPPRRAENRPRRRRRRRRCAGAGVEAAPPRRPAAQGRAAAWRRRAAQLQRHRDRAEQYGGECSTARARSPPTSRRCRRAAARQRRRARRRASRACSSPCACAAVRDADGRGGAGRRAGDPVQGRHAVARRRRRRRRRFEHAALFGKPAAGQRRRRRQRAAAICLRRAPPPGEPARGVRGDVRRDERDQRRFGGRQRLRDVLRPDGRGQDVHTGQRRRRQRGDHAPRAHADPRRAGRARDQPRGAAELRPELHGDRPRSDQARRQRRAARGPTGIRTVGAATEPSPPSSIRSTSSKRRTATASPPPPR